jgi:WD40 repeat protein
VSKADSAVTRQQQSRNRARWVLFTLLAGCSPPPHQPRLPPASAVNPAAASFAAENAPTACPCADLALPEVRAHLAEGRLERAARLLRRTEHRCGCWSSAARELERSVLAELGQPTDAAGRAALGAECARDRATAEAPPSIQTWYDWGMEELERDHRAEARRWLDRALWRLERWGRCRFGGGVVAPDAFMGLTDEARALDGSPDGKRVVVANGRELVVFEIPPAGVEEGAHRAYRYSLPLPARAMAVAWPLDDRMVVATSKNQLLLYHPPSGRLLAERTVPDIVDYGLAALGQSGLLVTAHRDRTVRFWDLRQLGPVGSRSTPEQVTSLSVAPGGVAVGLGEAGLVVFRGPLSTRSLAKALATLPRIAVQAAASRVAISPDSRRVIWSGPEGGGEVDLTTGVIRESPDLHKECVLFTPDGRLVTCSLGIEVERNGGQVASFDPGGSGYTTYADVKALAGGRLIATVTGHGQLHVWDTAEENPAEDKRLTVHSNWGAMPIDVCESAGAVLVGGLLWRPQSGELTELESAGAYVGACVAGRWLVTAPIGGDVIVDDLLASPPSKPRRLPLGDYVGMLYGRADGELVIATGDARLLVGSVGSSVVREIARGSQYGLGGYSHRQAFRDRRLAAGNGWIAIGDGRTVFWKDTTGPSLPRQLEGTIGGELATDAAGEVLVIGDHEGNLEVRDARGELRSRSATDGIPITALAVHPKEPWIAWGNEVGTIRVVSFEGKPVGLRVDCAGSRVGALRFFEDEWLVSSTADQRIRFWSLPDQRSGPILVRHAATSYVVSADPIPFVQPLGPASRDALRCHLGAYSWGFELCSDRFEVPDLSGRLFTHDETYREP